MTAPKQLHAVNSWAMPPPASRRSPLCRATCWVAASLLPAILEYRGRRRGRMGRTNMINLASQNIVALCDVDWDYTGKAFEEARHGHPKPENANRPADPPPTPGQAPVEFDRVKARRRVEGMIRLKNDTGQKPSATTTIARCSIAERYRRRSGRHRRSHARTHRAGRDGTQQTRVRSEAAYLVRRRSAPIVAQCPGKQETATRWATRAIR